MGNQTGGASLHDMSAYPTLDAVGLRALLVSLQGVRSLLGGQPLSRPADPQKSEMAT